jgi:hypothetical protein
MMRGEWVRPMSNQIEPADKPGVIRSTREKFDARYDAVMSPIVLRHSEHSNRIASVLNAPANKSLKPEEMIALIRPFSSEGSDIYKQALKALSTEVLTEAQLPSDHKELKALISMAEIIAPMIPNYTTTDWLWKDAALPLYDNLDRVLAGVEAIGITQMRAIELAMMHLLKVPVFRDEVNDTEVEVQNVAIGAFALSRFARTFGDHYKEARLALDCLSREAALRGLYAERGANSTWLKILQDTAETALDIAKATTDELVKVKEGKHPLVDAHIKKSRSAHALRGAEARHAPTRPAWEYVQAEWAAHGASESGYNNNKSDFARVYAKLVADKFGVLVKERTIREGWLKGV